MSEHYLTKVWYKNPYFYIVLGILIIYGFNLFIDVMDVDAAQYASISMEMSKSGSYLEVYHRGADYLDKPPLLFWLSSLSMSVFGIGNFAYKFPSFLLAILGIYSTYRFALLFYSKKTAVFAGIILATTQALFLITNDVRTDTNLLAFVIFSAWQLTVYLRTNQWKHLILGFIGVGGAMLAKGPIGIISVVVALGFDFLVQKQWKYIFKWQWLIGILIVAVILAPMTYGLYHQFDLHPEKTAYEIKSPSGVKFYYWTQSFGRITGESSWNNGSPPFFFVHSILWDFQPWILYLILGLIATVKSFFTKRKDGETREYITFGGFVLVFIALSLSKYKLPHYIFVTFPFAAIIAAKYLAQLEVGKKWVQGIQIFFNSLFWIIIGFGLIFLFPPDNILLPIVLVALFIASWVVFFKQKVVSNRLFFSTILTILGFNLMLASHFYPTLINGYQGSAQIGKIVHEKGLTDKEFFYFDVHEHSLDFYSQMITQGKQLHELVDLPEGTWIYTNDESFEKIKAAKIPFKVVEEFDDFTVTQLKLPFLFPSTREETLTKVYILERVR